MGFSCTMVGYPSPKVRAAEDLRTHQGKAMRISGGGVFLADATVNQTSGGIYVLVNKPNSGEDCELTGPPNIAKVVAGGAISIGAYVTINTSAKFVAHTIPASYENSVVPKLGVAWEAATADLDEIAVQLTNA